MTVTVFSLGLYYFKLIFSKKWISYTTEAAVRKTMNVMDLPPITNHSLDCSLSFHPFNVWYDWTIPRYPRFLDKIFSGFHRFPGASKTRNYIPHTLLHIHMIDELSSVNNQRFVAWWKDNLSYCEQLTLRGSLWKDFFLWRREVTCPFHRGK